jgi:RNA polymerase primary sigma factor
VHRYQKFTELDNACETLELKLRRDPNAVEISEALGWNVQLVNAFLQIPRQSNDMSSFDEWPGAILEPDQEDLVDQAETLKLASEALAQIEERQAEIIRMRFGIGGDEEMTLEEIGQIYGVTRERIRQIEGKGLRKLSRPDSKRRTQKQVGN